MTETLSYDPTPADAPEFSEEEQEALHAAEQLGEAESELYAGKYENAEQLEQAYLELQKKLGSNDDDDVEVDTEVDAEAETDVEAEVDTEVEAEVEEVPSDEVEKSTAKVF